MVPTLYSRRVARALLSMESLIECPIKSIKRKSMENGRMEKRVVPLNSAKKVDSDGMSRIVKKCL